MTPSTLRMVRVGELRSAPLLLHSFDFGPIAEHQAAGQWDALATELGRAGRGLAAASAVALLICTNTMHRVHAAVQQAAPSTYRVATA